MPIGTPIIIGFYPTSQSPVDERYLNEGVAYTNAAQVLSLIPLGSRSAYLPVNISGVLYWFLPDLVTLQPVAVGNDQTAEEVPITDSGAYFVSDNVEDALQEVGEALTVINESLTGLTKSVYEISFTATGSVATRISAAIAGIDYPTGWVLAAGVSPVDLSITHSLNRRVANVTICAVTGTEEQSLFNTAAYNGWKTPTINSLLIQSIATINKPIKIYITFV